MRVPACVCCSFSPDFGGERRRPCHSLSYPVSRALIKKKSADSLSTPAVEAHARKPGEISNCSVM